MFPDDPILAIVGAGAVGGYYGARLAQSGRRVHFLLRSDYAAVRAHGWQIRSRDGDFVLPAAAVHAHNTPATMPPADLVIVTLKATSNPQLPDLIRPLIHERTAILTLQNGLGNEAFLAEHFGADRILGGLVFACINRTGPGRIHHMDHGHIHLGEYVGGLSPRAERIADLFVAAGIRARALEQLAYWRWEKLLWNIPFNGLGALLDLSTDQLLKGANELALVRLVMCEVIAAAAAAGITLDKTLIDEKIEQTRSMGAYLSSMQIDRRLGRPMEIEAILGEPVRAALAGGYHPLRLEMIYRMLRALGDANDVRPADQ